MFDPIYSFTENSFGQFVIVVWLGTLLAILLQWSVRNSFRFVRDEKFVPVLGDMFTKYGEDAQAIILVSFTTLGWLVVSVVTFILNWLWFPCVVITGIIAMLYVARGVVRLKRNLEEHKADNTLHNPPKSR